MRVFVAGAAGVIGQRLVPLLTAAGHEVTGTTRSAARETEIRRLGATPVIVDGLDAVGPYRISNPGPGGLIFGYATVSERAIAEGVATLAEVISEL